MFAALVIPRFPLQAIVRNEREGERCPLVLTDPDFPQAGIVEFNQAAEDGGMTTGLTPNQARARCPNLILKPRSLIQEKSAADALLQIAYGFSPHIEQTLPGVCTLELRGLALNGAEKMRQWAGRIFHALASAHFQARVGLAVTPGLALLAARTTEAIQIVEDSAQFVAPLPVAVLEPPSEMAGILARWGIRNVGEFLALGKDRIAERLGVEALNLLEKVSPDSIRPLNLVSPPADFVEQTEFEFEIETIAPLIFILQRFVERLSQRVESLHEVIAELHLRMGLASGDTYDCLFKVPDPTTSVRVLFSMVHTRLETARTESPVVSLQLSAKTCRARSHQFGLFETSLRHPDQFAETLAQLTALCGPDRVGTPVLEQTHRPDAFRLRPPDFAALNPGVSAASNFDGLPLRRFRPAIPASIEFRGDRPCQIRSRILRASVADARGPFRSSGNWWDGGRWAREEWDVQTADGALYRIGRSGEQCFLEGIYD